MPAYHVKRTVVIEATEAVVRPMIEDFSQWPRWSPWLCRERSAKVTVFGTPGQTDHGYDWDGDLVGAGTMKTKSIVPGQQKMELTFLRPFKSVADVMIEVKSIGDSQTEVTWQMDAKVPFFLFFMVGMMKGMIGMDFQRGLKMLKELVETGAVNSNTEIVGIVDVPQAHWLGVETRCSMDDIGKSMSESMPTADKIAKDNQIQLQGPPGTLYHNVSFKKQTCHYTSIVQTAKPVQLDGVQTGTICACRAIKIVHTGHYDHLGNAWSTAMAYQRYKKLKMNKSQCGFEFYPNDPCETPETEWITEIYVPVKG